MSELSVKKAKKKRKPKSKSKKTKPKLTQEFQENEKQVEAIMKNTEFLTDSIAENSELGTAFFCNTVESVEPAPLETASSVVESEQSETPRTQTVSSFIQVEEEDPIIRVPSMKVVFNSDMMFVPSSSVNPYLPTAQVKNKVPEDDANLIRLVNRCHEEGNDHQVASAIALMNQTNFFKDDQLYATACEHDFNPILSVTKPGDSSTDIIPSRKLLTLTIKKLKFIEHPLQQQEHILVSKLEDHLALYFKRQENKVISYLKNELDNLRTCVNGLLEHGGVGNFIEFEKNLSKLKELRTTLHQEETIQKDLLRSILDTWIRIKKLRKQQQFHWTSLELKIKLNEVDLDEDNAAWSKRFDTELNEIYREELEAYYKEKRVRKSSPESKLTRPKKPNIEKIKRNLKETLKKCSRNPGEPEIEIIRSNLTDPNRPLEAIKSFFMRIFFDDQLVGSTKCFRMEPDLSLAVNESFGIYLDRRVPKEVKIKLYEKKKLALKVANILIPLPFTGQHESDVISFSSHKQGSIVGQLVINFHCEEGVYSRKIVEKILPTPAAMTEIPQNILPTWQPTAPAKNSAETPQIVATTSRSEQTAGDDSNDENNQRCTFQETLLEFCPPEEIENNQRLNLLSSKYRRDIKTKNVKLVPYVENKIEQECEERVIDIGNWMNPIDVHKHNGKKHLRNIYEVVRSHCEKLSQVTGNSGESLYENDVVTLKSFLMNLTEKEHGRPLNPKKKPQPVMRTYQNVSRFNVVVNLIRATGIPVRSFPTLERRDSSNAPMFDSQTFKYSNVKPYVSVVYMDKADRTVTADGSSPTWNEQLNLQITRSATDLKGDLKIAIFDEYVENHVGDNIGMEIHQRYQANWLAEYRLPISTILAKQRIEGILELTSPKVLLGYNTSSINELASVENVPEVKNSINLWLIISIEPSFEMPKVDTKNLECAELNEVRRHMQQWCLQAKMMRPNRFIDPLVCTMDGKRVCLSRLLEPVPLPIENSQNLLESACRYVSLLNVFRSYEPCMYFAGIWLNNQTLLDTGWGSQKDLGVLLANFLLTIGMRCWVVLGTSYLHGESAFVLYEEDNEYTIINPSTGKKYSTRDPFCPMKEAFYVFSQNNVYLNIQKEHRVYMMSFNTRDSSSWFPMFTKRNPAPLGGVQKIAYVYKTSNCINELRKNIEYKVMKKINSWRPMQKTVWNRNFQKPMLKILVDLENESNFTSVPSGANHAERIMTEFENYKIYGFTLNFSYTNLSSIADRIKSTGIHFNGDKRLEFGIAVHVHAYPYNVLSVWIFLIAATPK